MSEKTVCSVAGCCWAGTGIKRWVIIAAWDCNEAVVSCAKVGRQVNGSFHSGEMLTSDFSLDEILASDNRPLLIWP